MRTEGFLFTHTPDCNVATNPCPTCVAWEKIRAAGIADEIKTEITRWGRTRSDEEELLQRSVESLDLSVRTETCLKNDNIKTLGELLKLTEYECLRIPNLGRKSLNEINAALSSLGLKLGQNKHEKG